MTTNCTTTEIMKIDQNDIRFNTRGREIIGEEKKINGSTFCNEIKLTKDLEKLDLYRLVITKPKKCNCIILHIY